MLVNNWVETLWTILNVRKKTLAEYKRLYKKHLQPVIGECEINAVEPVVIQQLLRTLSPQTAKHTLMVLKSLYREALLYKVAKTNPTVGLKTIPIPFEPKKFLGCCDVDALCFK